MKIRYKLFIVIISASLLSITVFQARFIASDYQSKKLDFEKDINRCLSEALDQEFQHRKEEYLNVYQEGLKNPDLVKVAIRIDPQSQEKRAVMIDPHTNNMAASFTFNQEYYPEKGTPEQLKQRGVNTIMANIRRMLDSDAVFAFSERLEEHIVEQFVKKFEEEDLLRSLYKEKLSELGITTNFQLALEKDRNEQTNSRNPFHVSTRAHLSDFMFEKFFVRAYFDEPSKDVITRMWFSTGSSLIIILLTGLAFSTMYRTIKKQKKLSDMKDDFIDNITHELQTPIATLMASIESMEKYNVLEDPQKTKNYLAISRSSINRLSSMVDGILSTSFHEQKESAPHLQKIELKKLFDHLSERRNIHEDKKVQIDFPHDLAKTEIISDPKILQSVFGNLLSNSIKYHDKTEVRIKIEVKPADSGHLFSFSDNGPGIPAEYAEKIFEKFYRIPGDNLEQTEGFGIGLFQVKSALEKLGGTIQLDTKNELGTTFLIYLPLMN